jgi:malonyl CoA-acyl carrier protein transacylase
MEGRKHGRIDDYSPADWFVEIERMRAEVVKSLTIPPAEQVEYLRQIIEKETKIDQLVKIIRQYNEDVKGCQCGSDYHEAHENFLDTLKEKMNFTP